MIRTRIMINLGLSIRIAIRIIIIRRIRVSVRIAIRIVIIRRIRVSIRIAIRIVIRIRIRIIIRMRVFSFDQQQFFCLWRVTIDLVSYLPSNRRRTEHLLSHRVAKSIWMKALTASPNQFG